MGNRIFISYAHANDEHIARVRGLVAALRKAGQDAAWDGDVTQPQGPPEGWWRWMLDRFDEADWILVICEATYYRRFRGKEREGVGGGGLWEGAIVGDTLFLGGTRNYKFIPVLFDGAAIADIPDPLRRGLFYRFPGDVHKLLQALARSELSATKPAPIPPTGPRGDLGRRVSLLLALLALSVAGLVFGPHRSVQNVTPSPRSGVKALASPPNIPVAGRVVDEDGIPIVGAIVRVGSASATTVTGGQFALNVPSAGTGQTLTIEVEATGFHPWRNRYSPGGGNPTAILIRDSTPPIGETPSS